MKFKLSHNEFMFINEIIENRVGIHLTEEKAYLIESRLSKIVAGEGLNSFEEYCAKLSKRDTQEKEIAKIIDAITTNETYWFRDKTPWLVLEEKVIPKLVEDLRQGKKTYINIWSAACSTGQEPYSIVMLIDKYLRTNNIRDISLKNFRVFASDISREALEIAKAGFYDNIAVSRGLDQEFKEKYFQPYEKGYKINDFVRESVSFRNFNLKDNYWDMDNYDLIFCRYVLIYFKDQLKNYVLEKIKGTLNQNGILILGSSEIYSDYQSHFEQHEHNGGIYYMLKKT